MTYDPLDPRPIDQRHRDDRVDRPETMRDRYDPAFGLGSPTQTLVGLVLLIALFVGFGLFFANDTSDGTTQMSQSEVPQPNPSAPQIEPPATQPGQSTQAPTAPAEGTSTSTN